MVLLFKANLAKYGLEIPLKTKEFLLRKKSLFSNQKCMNLIDFWTLIYHFMREIGQYHVFDEFFH